MKKILGLWFLAACLLNLLNVGCGGAANNDVNPDVIDAQQETEDLYANPEKIKPVVIE